MAVLGKVKTTIGALDRADPEYKDKKALADYIANELRAPIRFRIKEISDIRLLERALGRINALYDYELRFFRHVSPQIHDVVSSEREDNFVKVEYDKLTFARTIIKGIEEHLEALRSQQQDAGRNASVLRRAARALRDRVELATARRE